MPFITKTFVLIFCLIQNFDDLTANIHLGNYITSVNKLCMVFYSHSYLLLWSLMTNLMFFHSTKYFFLHHIPHFWLFWERHGCCALWLEAFSSNYSPLSNIMTEKITKTLCVVGWTDTLLSETYYAKKVVEYLRNVIFPVHLFILYNCSSLKSGGPEVVPLPIWTASNNVFSVWSSWPGCRYNSNSCFLM